MDVDILKSIRILALYETEVESIEAWYKSICRWYSREFHTPLSEVMEMTEEEVIRIYYEDVFYRLKTSNSEEDQTQYDDIKSKLLAESTHKGGKTLDEIAAEEDDDWYANELKAIEEQEKAQKISKKFNKNSKLDKQSEKPNLKEEIKQTSTFFDGESGVPPLFDEE